ncbi:cysteine desulfurase [Shumkonia mesophila]|uniref:cysteine desulfurase n=1 Tax=Shumkonia mesophila TaxID=2838854 RepID=UPI002934C27F|nr:cysteine desulfurase [Shumkonia mesophila]
MNTFAPLAAARPSSVFVPAFDAEAARRDFPILATPVIHGRAFLDSAASAQKPMQVIDAVRRCYEAEYANIHRGVYELSALATKNFEVARDKVRTFLNARESSEIIFVRGGTEGVNLVAYAYGDKFIGEGDEIILTYLEHHSNIVPWQLLAERVGAKIRPVPIDDAGELIMEEYERLLGPRTKLVAVTHASNALGTLPPVKQMIEMAHAQGAVVLIDGAQGAPHLKVDVQDLDCDFYVFSGHKVYGPSGIGVLYGKKAHLLAMPPWQGGGDMIETVSFEKTTFAPPPNKFEAGTPHISGATGLAAAIDYVTGLGLENIAAHEHSLLEEATARMRQIPGVRIYGEAKNKAAILSFMIDGAHPHDVGTIFDHHGVAVRAGHHCAQPVMERYGIPGTVRASFALYNTRHDVNLLIEAVDKVKEIFK